jgi:hypothetical protein
MQNNLIFYNIDENEEENCPELIINFFFVFFLTKSLFSKEANLTRIGLVLSLFFPNRNASVILILVAALKSQIAHFEGTARSKRQGLFRQRQNCCRW